MTSETAHRRRWLILAILSLSLVVIGLDILIITIALPDIQSDVNASASQLQWMVNAYTLSFGGFLLLGGSLADRFGRKALLLVGLSAFLVFSIGATYSSSADMLIACRAGMGIGSALIMPTTLAIIKNVFPPEEQSKAIGIWTAAAGIGVPMGPVIGGLLLNHFWWGSVFLINIPVAGLALIGAAVLIPESRDEQHKGLDFIGAGLSVAGLVALVYGLVQGPSYGWGDARTWALVGGGLVLLAGFGYWESRAPYPMIQAKLFRNPSFSGPVIAITCVAFSLFGELFMITQYLQDALDLRPLQAGVRLLAICVLIVASGMSPTLVQKLGLKPTISGGLAFIAAAGVVLSTVTVQTDDRVLIALGLLGFGLGLAMPAAADSILASSPAEQSGAGSAMTDTSMQIGGALGVAVIGSVMTTSYRNSLTGLDAVPAGSRGTAKDSIGGAHTVAAQLGSAGDSLLTSANHAFENAISNASLVGAVIAGVGALVTAVILPMRPVADAKAAAGSTGGTAPQGQDGGTVQPPAEAAKSGHAQ